MGEGHQSCIDADVSAGQGKKAVDAGVGDQIEVKIGRLFTAGRRQAPTHLGEIFVGLRIVNDVVIAVEFGDDFCAQLGFFLRGQRRIGRFAHFGQVQPLISRAHPPTQ